MPPLNNDNPEDLGEDYTWNGSYEGYNFATTDGFLGENQYAVVTDVDGRTDMIIANLAGVGEWNYKDGELDVSKLELVLWLGPGYHNIFEDSKMRVVEKTSPKKFNDAKDNGVEPDPRDDGTGKEEPKGFGDKPKSE